MIVIPDWLLIAFSALLLHFSLYRPQYFFWTALFFLVPLFLIALNKPKKLSYKHGFFWGLIFFFFHTWGLTKLLILQGNGIGRLIFPFCFIFYCAGHCGLWFFLAKKTSILFGTIFSWIIWSFLFFLWVPEGLLWISGDYIGNPLMFPLLPFAELPKTLRLLFLLGRETFLLFLILFSMMIALFLTKQKKRFLLLSVFFIAPFIYGFISPKKKEDIPNFVKTIGYICPPDCKEFCHPMDVAHEIYYRMKKLLKKYPETKIIVMPELSYRFPLNKQSHIVTMWNNNALHDTVQLFIGACHQKKEKIFNAAYWIKNGKIQKIYNKSQLMPLAEYVPSIYKTTPFFNNIFLNKKKEFSSEKNENINFVLEENLTLEPQICAELFFKKNKNFKVSSKKSFILSIVNDLVFPSDYLQHLMFLWCKYIVIEQNKKALFVGYSFGCFVSTTNTLIFPC